MRTEKLYLACLASSILALGMVLSADVLGQSGTARITVANGEDMRLWSFGDCDRRFPYVDTDSHKECAKIVGSAEAKDARALKVCEVSLQPNLEEIERCKGAYYANKEKAARDIAATHALATAQAAASPETIRMVKAITSAAVENKEGASVVPPPPEAKRDSTTPLTAEATESSSPMPTIGLALLGVVAVGFGAKSVIRKKQDESAQS
jgi:hypothetical protein